MHSVAQTIGARLWNNSAILGALVAGVVAVFASLAGTQPVVNSDTIKLNGTTYRLWGIDPAESKQTCADGTPGRSRGKCEILSSKGDQAAYAYVGDAISHSAPWLERAGRMPK